MAAGRGRAALVLSLLASAAIDGCRPSATTWQAQAERAGCTAALLASTARYDSSQVLQLAGTYRLVQIDTARGWFELEQEYGDASLRSTMRLWVADSATRYSRVNPLTQQRMAVDRPIVGMLSGYEAKGFTADNPQIQVTGKRHDGISVVFDPRPTLDGSMWGFPIERRGSWGFGGYFSEGSYVVPVGLDGRPLGQRAGFYCAFRVE
jgi:hypothetical protein